jgi:thioredoxin 1
MPTKAVTDASFQSDVLDSSTPVLVDFWAEWCGPCKMIGPSLEEIADELGDRVTIAKMDIMENPEVPGRIGVQSIPYLVLFKDGKKVNELLGARPKSQLKGWIESVI